MRTILLYVSKYGASRDYARYTEKETGFPAFSADAVTEEELLGAERIVTFGGSFASRIESAKWLKKHQKLLAGKQIVMTFTGLTPFDKTTMDRIYLGSFKGTIYQRCPYFYLPGRINAEELKGWDRTIVKMVLKAIENTPQEKRDAFQKTLFQLRNQDIDFVKTENLEPLLSYLA